MMSGRVQTVVLLVVAWCVATPVSLSAQEDDPASSAEVERMVRAGMVEALQSRFRGGRTPEETALSIISEVAAVKNGRTGASLRATKGRIGEG